MNILYVLLLLSYFVNTNSYDFDTRFLYGFKPFVRKNAVFDYTCRHMGENNYYPQKSRHKVVFSLTKKEGAQRCVGTIMTDYWVVTAASCLRDRLNNKVYQRSFATGAFWDERYYYYVRKTVIHPHFAMNPMPINDIAMVRSERPIDFSLQYTMKVTWPSGPELPPFKYSLYTFGWGELSYYETDTHYHHRMHYMHNISHDQCLELLPKHANWYFTQNIWAFKRSILCFIYRKDGSETPVTSPCNVDRGAAVVADLSDPWWPWIPERQALAIFSISTSDVWANTTNPAAMGLFLTTKLWNYMGFVKHVIAGDKYLPPPTIHGLK